MELVAGKDPSGLYIFRFRRCSRLKSPDDISFFSTSMGIILLALSLPLPRLPRLPRLPVLVLTVLPVLAVHGTCFYVSDNK